MNLDQLLTNEIRTALAIFGQPIPSIQLQPTNPEFEGSHTLVCFPLTKLSKKSPEETARMIGEKLLADSKLISKFNVVKGFLNLSVSDETWINLLHTIQLNKSFGVATATGKEIMVEYSSPNTNKPLHLGHLRNNFLGYSVAAIHEALGYKVHKVQIINDRGIHICKSMAAWSLYGNGETPESSGMKGDKLVGKYYVKFEEESRSQINEVLPRVSADSPFAAVCTELYEMRSFPELFVIATDRFKKLYLQQEPVITVNDRPMLEKALSDLDKLVASGKLLSVVAQDLLRRWEAKDPETLKLWNTMNGWVYKGFDTTYRRMGVDFEKLYYESQTYLLGKEEVMRGVENGAFFRKDDGSVWVDLTAEGLDQKVLLRSDGTSVYMTQDIGTAILRFRDFPLIEGQVYTVGNEQEYHFKVLFLILTKLGYDWAKKCYHLSYGMVDLPSGKMKSREGTVVDADDLMDEMVEDARAQTMELGKVEEMKEAEISALIEMVGMGALKYFLLKVDPKKRMLFDPQESISLQGHTGPFIQYTHARIKAMLRKASERGVSSGSYLGIKMLESAERNVIARINAYPTKIEEAAREHSPAVVANYAYELARDYNQFYQSIPVLTETDPQKLALRLTFSTIAAEVLKKAMALLGIQVPERM